ncbi:MAG: ABC transporter substrate-binding protein [Butyrivibrio sp.]|uniref:ABC transporter substrate-binding protein n=1 Tax=Butyrivibrio sp. TaxID=28121 RepID=UPI0025D43FFD|nr:ABC transporter substrate-binding protein [Butyrivibrio sp.]MCR5770645.1 ABC transporter substrate-binding protein [Butyrivibrio sp.]
MKKTQITKKLMSFGMAAAMTLALVGCGEAGTQNEGTDAQTGDGTKEYTIGICNYVDDASLNQIVDNIQSELDVIAEREGVKFNVKYDNANADANVLNQIIANFQADDVDLMIGVTTPVAMAMQGATEGGDIPVVFSAVSDPVAAGLVESLEAPGSNVTGTSDMLNTEAIMNMILAADPDITKVGLLYDAGQDSSTTAINDAKEFLEAKGIEIIEQTGTNVEEVTLAANALVSAGAEAVFTPTDNTIMTAELSIYEIFRDAGIPHYCGADSFALNGAFLGFGVNYANLGIETADMAAEILLDQLDPASVPVKTFDNGIVTLNEEMMDVMGMTLDSAKEVFGDYATSIQTIKTAENFE